MIFVSGFSQSSNKNTLQKEIDDNGKLFSANIDKAYPEINKLLRSAEKLKDSALILKLLDRKCRFFYSKNKIDSLLTISEKLQSFGLSYGDLYSSSMGYVYTAEAYANNKFYDKALHYLDLAYNTLEKDRSKDPKVFFAKTNVLNSFANVYAIKGEPRKAVQKLYKVIKSSNELNDKEQVKSFQYLNFSNIASLYVLYDIDSANYFAEKSISLKSPKNADDKVMMSNYLVLGKVFREKKDYSKSLFFYKKSISVSDHIGMELNSTPAYSEIFEIYKLLGQKDSARIYENKLKQNEISELQSKYNSLHEIIDNDHKEEIKSRSLYIFLAVFAIFAIVTVIVLYIRLKSKRKYQTLIPAEEFNNVLNLVKKNDPASMFAFEQLFPNFTNKLLKINPTLSSSEIEFCTFLKLKLSTKEISKITLTEHRTVQNKKYRIRKRLHIPTSFDIYNWFEDI